MNIAPNCTKISRGIAVFLSVGGLSWAIILSMYIIGISVHSPDGGARFAWFWIPGFACHLFWILRALKIWMGRWRHLGWLGAVGVNVGYLLMMFPPDEIRWTDSFGVVASGWLLVAAGSSMVGFCADIGSKPPIKADAASGEKRVSESELKRLVEEHRKGRA